MGTEFLLVQEETRGAWDAGEIQLTFTAQIYMGSLNTLV